MNIELGEKVRRNKTRKGKYRNSDSNFEDGPSQDEEGVEVELRGSGSLRQVKFSSITN